MEDGARFHCDLEGRTTASNAGTITDFQQLTWAISIDDERIPNTDAVTT